MPPFKLKTVLKKEMLPYGTPARHKVTVQGKLLTWKDQAVSAEVPHREKRGEIRGFSKSSRFRLLKLIATINWEVCVPTLFLTLTYPDRCGLQDAKQLTRDRSVFWRYIENHLGRQVAAVWRTEWKVRQSGEMKGMFMPHVHMLILNCPYISVKAIRWYWRKSLRIWGKPFVWVERCEETAKAAIYVAKYCGKVSPDLLDYGSYLNTPTGRCWGIFRRQLVPFFDKLELDLPSNDSVAELRATLERLIGRTEASDYSSFTILGDKVPEIAKEFLSKPEDLQGDM